MKLLLRMPVLLAVVSLWLVSCERDTPYQNEMPVEVAEMLNERFANYSIVDIDASGILANSLKHNDLDEFNLNLGITEKPNWSFNVTKVDFIADDYTAYATDAEGNWVEVEDSDRFDPFEGPSIDKSTVGLFLMEENDLTGNIFEGDVEYYLEPLNKHYSSAEPNEYIYYKVSDVRVESELECEEVAIPGESIINQKIHPDDFNSGSITLAASTCDELDVALVADYHLFQHKFSGRYKTTLNWCKTRILFGGYRYWKYNRYPVYPYLRNSYVRTSSSNAPTRTTHQHNALKQWKDWGNQNITRRDCNILFSGRNYASVVGLAYGKTVCKDPTWAYGYIEKHTWSDSYLNKTTGHEIGHTLGASHSSSGFMATGTNVTGEMSTETKNQLNAHRSQYSGCMSNRSCRNSRNL